MNDPYPTTLHIEIDRPQLERYLRVKALLCWTLPLGLFGILFGFASVGQAIDHGVHSLSELVLFVAKRVGIGFGLSLLIASLLYLVVSHRMAARHAATLDLSVEGAFLHLHQHTHVLTDRKMHFRSIVDYATMQDRLMRQFDICALQMTTTGGGVGSTVTIPGVKDCLKVRDLLSDIDRLRENQ